MEKSLELTLSVDDVNTILGALGKEPFAQVFALIGTIQQQAMEQLNGDASELGMPRDESDG